MTPCAPGPTAPVAKSGWVLFSSRHRARMLAPRTTQTFRLPDAMAYEAPLVFSGTTTRTMA